MSCSTWAHPHKDQRGTYVNWYGFREDIDRRVKADGALRASETRYRSVVETVQEGIWTVDAEYHTTFVNDQMVKMLGCSRDKMMGQQD